MILKLGDDAGRGSWTLRYTSPIREICPETGKPIIKRRETGCGAYPAYGIARARERAEVLRDMLRSGVDPLAADDANTERQRAEIAERKRKLQRDAATVESVARDVHSGTLDKSENKRKGGLAATFRNPKHRAQWISSLEIHVFPTLGARPVASVPPSELLALLLSLRDSPPETSRRLRQRLETVFEHAMLRKMCDSNPARALRRALRQKSTKKHFRSLDFRDVPAFVVALRDNRAGFVSARLTLEFAILAAARTGEIVGATWGEINEGERVWTIPGARMKRGIEHRVPLTPRMLEILREARALVHVERGDDAATLARRPVFPSPNDTTRPLSNMAMLALLDRLKTGATLPDGTAQTYRDVTTTHGACRCTFSTWARETTRHKDSVIEAALAHAEKKGRCRRILARRLLARARRACGAVG